MYYNQHPEMEAKSTDMVVPHRHKMEKRSRNSQNLKRRNTAQESKDEMQKKEGQEEKILQE